MALPRKAFQKPEVALQTLPGDGGTSDPFGFPLFNLHGDLSPGILNFLSVADLRVADNSGSTKQVNVRELVGG